MRRLSSWLIVGVMATAAWAKADGNASASASSIGAADSERVEARADGKPLRIITREAKAAGETPGGGGTESGGASRGGGGGFGLIRVDPLNKLELVKGYVTTMGEYSRSTADATTTAIGAVMQAADMLREKGADAQIAYFSRVLAEARNDTVKRAIRMQLIDAYRRAGQADKALDELKVLILAANEPMGKEATTTK